MHEVWLINVDGKRLVALGFLAAWDKGEFQVPVGLIEKGYRIVDISVEPEDGDPRPLRRQPRPGRAGLIRARSTTGRRSD